MKLPTRLIGLIEDVPDDKLLTVPGLGLGTSPQAKRWALIGYLVSTAINSPINNRGRPTKGPLNSKDAYRAYVVWRIAQNLPPTTRKSISNRELIRLATILETHLGIPNAERAFLEHATLEQSISRGKRILEISSDWESTVCEKIQNN